MSGILITNIKETLENPIKFETQLLKLKFQDIFEPCVMPAAIVMFLSATCSGIIFVLTPEISNFLNIENKGWFFIFYVMTTIIVRLFFSSISDKIGRRKTLTIGMIFLLVSMGLIGFSKDIFSYTLASIIFGIATGTTSPTLFAWTADLSHPERRGIGSGTMFIALELGIMVGSLSTLITYNNTLKSIPIAFLVGSVMALIAITYLIWHQYNRKSMT
jgi:MFS family permease